MSQASATKVVKALEQLIRLYELRQAKAAMVYQQELTSLNRIKKKYVARQSDYATLLEKISSLDAISGAEENINNLQAQKDIQVHRRWLKYDAEKADFIFKRVSSELQKQEKITQASKEKWTKLRLKNEQYQERLDTLLTKNEINQSFLQDFDLEEAAALQLLGGRANA